MDDEAQVHVRVARLFAIMALAAAAVMLLAWHEDNVTACGWAGTSLATSSLGLGRRLGLLKAARA